MRKRRRGDKPARQPDRRQAGADGQAARPASDVELDDLPAPWLHAVVHSLDPADQLCLFQASKQLAMVVLQQASHVQLTLSPSKGTTQKQQVEQWQHTVQPILAAAPTTDLHVGLKGGLPAVYASLPHDRITQLSLQEFELEAVHLRRKLHLASCTHLHTLTLGEGCTHGMSARTFAQLQQQSAAWLPPSLRSLHVFRSADKRPVALLQDLLQKLQHQLTELRYIGKEHRPSCSMDELPLPNLPQLTHFSTTGTLAGCTVAQLLAAPALTHVEAVLSDLSTGQDHSKKACTWQQLRLTNRVCRLEGLSRLPLPGIQRVIIHGVDQYPRWHELNLGASDHHHIASLSACAGLQCEGVWHAQLQQPVFMMQSIRSSELISLCASRVVTPGTCLMISTAPLLGIPPAIVRQLPPTITTLWWFDYGLASLVPELPAHITLLVLSVSLGGEAILDQLMAALDATAGRDHVAVAVEFGSPVDCATRRRLAAKYGRRVRLLPRCS